MLPHPLCSSRRSARHFPQRAHSSYSIRLWLNVGEKKAFDFLGAARPKRLEFVGARPARSRARIARRNCPTDSVIFGPQLRFPRDFSRKETRKEILESDDGSIDEVCVLYSSEQHINRNESLKRSEKRSRANSRKRQIANCHRNSFHSPQKSVSLSLSLSLCDKVGEFAPIDVGESPALARVGC